MIITFLALASTTSDVSLPPPLDYPPLTQGKFYKMVIKEIPGKWHQFGVLLNIPSGTLDAITDRDSEHCFLKVFSIWKNEEPRPLTWTIVVDVLKDMREKRLARDIMDKLAVIPHSSVC